MGASRAGRGTARRRRDVATGQRGGKNGTATPRKVPGLRVGMGFSSRGRGEWGAGRAVKPVVAARRVSVGDPTATGLLPGRREVGLVSRCRRRGVAAVRNAWNYYYHHHCGGLYAIRRNVGRRRQANNSKTRGGGEGRAETRT